MGNLKTICAGVLALALAVGVTLPCCAPYAHTATTSDATTLEADILRFLCKAGE